MKTYNLYKCLSLMVCCLFVSCLAMGCKASECQQMMQCCDAVKGMDGVGKRACGSLAEATKDPNTCREIIKTVRYMAEDRKKPIPAACKVPEK